MLVLITDLNWDLADIPDLIVLTRMGNVIGAKGTEASLNALGRDRRVSSVEASTPQTDLHRECVQSMKFVKAIEARLAFQTSGVDENGSLAVVGIIDAGIDIFHQAFRNADGTTRILAVWDQTDPTGAPPPGFESAGGTLHSGSMIDQYLREGTAEFGAKYPRRQNKCHGTHVTSIAAGSQFSSFPGGVAPAACLLIVVTGKLEVESDMPNSLGYSLSHVAALSWLDQYAKQLDPNLPLVVNMSMGQNSGAHDGTSLLELSCDQFSGNGRVSGRVIVKSAGNMRDRKSHAAVTLSPGMIDSLEFQNEPNGSPRKVRLDTWFPSHVQFRFKLKSPSGDAADTIDWTKTVVDYNFQNGNQLHAIYTRLHPDNGLSRLVIELRSGSATSIEHIVNHPWILDIEAVNAATNVRLHCWVDAMERSAVEFTNHANEEYTLSVPGTARTVIAVGAIDARGVVRVGSFSGYGRTRDEREKPEIAAPGVEINAACSQTDDRLRSETGTSMAAPHVTGAIALLFSACRRHGITTPNAVQVAQALMNSAQAFTGTHNPGRGFGDLDVQKFLSSFVPVNSSPTNPAPSSLSA